ncbi:MAG: DUF3072 domain-containing protein [Actinomycetota bacterium]
MTDPTAQAQPDEQPGPASESHGETIGATGDAQDSSLEKDPADWVSGDDPMTEAQRSYLDTLAKQAGEELSADLTKAEASQHIERLRDQTGQG